jgi:TIR domain
MTTKRFRIALSFAGEKRDFVAEVAAILAKEFGGTDRILYDKFHLAEFSRHELAFYLPDLYEKESELIVAVLCPDYEKKEWCGLEWNAIFGMLKKGNVSEVMLTRFGKVEGEGLHGLAGYTDLDELTPKQAAHVILERLAFNEQQRRNPPSAVEAAMNPEAKCSPLSADTSESKSQRDYEYDICVSYAPDPFWGAWVREKFVPRLDAYLRIEVGRMRISAEYQIQSGAPWNPNLGRRVARSQLMLPILTATYFKEECCVRELALMFEREWLLDLEGSADDYGLLIPIWLGDGVTFPDLIGRVNPLDFRQFADLDLPNGSQRAADFNSKVQELAVVIAQTLPRLPEGCSDEWEEFTGNSFLERLRSKKYFLQKPSRLAI